MLKRYMGGCVRTCINIFIVATILEESFRIYIYIYIYIHINFFFVAKKTVKT